ncbi:DEKNAAC103769 [Brettanomyces naardenensis]|uniref:DEKNAAC103769 n=1 Tax=Brettanomyces naardenensis TaxID=13370 RepID=A0A448YP56_BRENA|nr:DEKNAAC103769 [Brettanomyces naardenensis]
MNELLNPGDTEDEDVDNGSCNVNSSDGDTGNCDHCGRPFTPIWGAYKKDYKANSKIIERAKCKFCSKKVLPRPKENMLHHAYSCRLMHADADYDFFVGVQGQANIKRFFGTAKKAKTASEEKNLALARFFFSVGYSFLSIENMYFAKLLSTLMEGNFKPYGRRKLVNAYLPRLFSEIPPLKVDSESVITLSIDGWTKRGSENLYGISMSADGEERLLKLIPLEEKSATAEELLKYLREVCKDIEMEHIGAVVTDGASTVKKMRECFVAMNPSVVEFTCCVHKMNKLCEGLMQLEAFKSVKKRSLSLNGSIVKSNKLSAALRRLTEQHARNGKIRSLEIFSHTRFSTVHACLRRLLLLQQEV